MNPTSEPGERDPLAQRHRPAAVETVDVRPGHDPPACVHCGAAGLEPAIPRRDTCLWLHMPEDDPHEAWSARGLERQYGVRRFYDDRALARVGPQRARLRAAP